SGASARWRGGLCVGQVTTTAAAAAAATGTATASARRHVTTWRRGGVACAATRRTRSRSSGGAAGRASRSARARSRCDIECLLELLQRARQARRAVRGGDAEHTRGGLRVELEHDAKRDHLALAGGERAERGLELRREAVRQRLLVSLRDGGALLPPQPAALGAEVVERDRAGELAEPGAWRAAALVEAVPEPQAALERLRGEVLGHEPVAREPGEVAVDVVEVPLGGLREGHACHTPPVDGSSHVWPRAWPRNGSATALGGASRRPARRETLQRSPLACGSIVTLLFQGLAPSSGRAVRAAWPARSRPRPACPSRAPPGRRADAGSPGARGRRRGPRRARPRGRSRAGRGSSRAAPRRRSRAARGGGRGRRARRPHVRARPPPPGR